MKAIFFFTILSMMCLVQTAFCADKVVVIPLVEKVNSSDPIRIKKVINTYNLTIPADIWNTQYAYCPEGYIAIGGGYDVGTSANRKMNAIYSYPATTGWVVAVYNRTTEPVNTNLKVYAICLYGDYE